MTQQKKSQKTTPENGTKSLMTAEAVEALKVEAALIRGDLASLSPQERVNYVRNLCGTLGLNPLSNPFGFIEFKGKVKLYALKDCTEQLRKVHGVSITSLETSSMEGIFIVKASARDKNGKEDVATGAVPLLNLRGEDLANALMKAETKAKRRVTLSICGLGCLDESELDTMKGATVIDTSESAKKLTKAKVEPEAPRQFYLYDLTREGGINEANLPACIGYLERNGAAEIEGSNGYVWRSDERLVKVQKYIVPPEEEEATMESIFRESISKVVDEETEEEE